MNRARLRMTLGTFFLCLTALVLASSHIFTSRQLAATRKELEAYQYQYGHLVVDDSARPNVLAYSQMENPWKWHVRFPKGSSYKMMCGVGKVPTRGIPNVSQLQHVQETWVAGASETGTMFVSLTESGRDSLKFSIGCDGSQTVNQIIPKSDVYSHSVFNLFSVGQGSTYTAAANEPFVLFYQTERTASSAGDSANGIVVWLVPGN